MLLETCQVTQTYFGRPTNTGTLSEEPIGDSLETYFNQKIPSNSESIPVKVKNFLLKYGNSHVGSGKSFHLQSKMFKSSRVESYYNSEVRSDPLKWSLFSTTVLTNQGST